MLELEIVFGVAAQYLGWLHGKRVLRPRWWAYVLVAALAGVLLSIGVGADASGGHLLSATGIWIAVYALGYAWGRAARIADEMTPAPRQRA